MAADLWAALVSACVLALAAFFAIRLTFGRKADPKFEFLNSLLKGLEEQPQARHKHAA